MKFHGGIHPKYNKDTAGAPIEEMPLLGRYVVPLSQHLGAPGEAIVEKGQEVKRGEPLSKAAGFVSVPVHAPTSGKVKSVGEFPHPMGRTMPAVEIESDGADEWWEGVKPRGEWRGLDADAVKKILCDAGLVGMGGATFPTHVKLSPPKDKPIRTFILNAAECEPFLTSDHRVMLEHAGEVMEGVGLFMKTLGVERAFIGVENNKPDAYESLEKACPADVKTELVFLETKYPQGSEKHLIRALTGREVPSGGLPMDVGCLVQNVGTAKAAFDAVEKGIPLIERVATVTGNGIRQPKNVLFRVGAPLADILEFCGGLNDDATKVILGGPMMGVAQHSLEAPAIKGTSGVLCFPRAEIYQYTTKACVRCGRCIDVCPMGLTPSVMGLLAERERWEELCAYNLADCMECGSCAWTCPSSRPLVQFIRRGKVEVREILKRRKEAAS
ncbi:MAG: electron transport complex subunit RsxC [Candidatus Eisenbacteria bacterium]|nr:electron transport complex subunit RsxC [Candidatus Eisenbacteria bacterium]